MCILSQAQQKSHVHLIREPLEILGDIHTGCTALIQFRFGSDFPKEARNITMLPKCCIKTLSPSAKKNILDFRSQNKGCYRGILYIIVCSFVFVPISPVKQPANLSPSHGSASKRAWLWWHSPYGCSSIP